MLMFGEKKRKRENRQPQTKASRKEINIPRIYVCVSFFQYNWGDERTVRFLRPWDEGMVLA